MGEMSPWHWLIVVAVALLLFGARRLPDAARSLGQSARILKAELHAESRASAPSETAAPAASDPQDGGDPLRDAGSGSPGA